MFYIMLYNLNYKFNYDNDDDYRLHLLNSYNIFLDESMKIDDIFSILSEKQNNLYLEINQNLMFSNMLNDILKQMKKSFFLSSSEELFIYLHNYDMFCYLHNVICNILNNDDTNLKESCNLLKNKIVNNI